MSAAFDDATAQAEQVRTGQATPEHLLAAALARINALNPTLNAVVIPTYERAAEEAADLPPDGPFRGVPYLMKDLTLTTKGDLTCQSIPGIRRHGHQGEFDSYYIRRMRQAGFVLAGKTNLPQMGLSYTTEPACWGPARNPWNTRYSTGGSSGGSCAAVSAGMVSVAHANDGGGSIRVPASHCGVIGLKGSRGRVSAGPAVNASDDVSGLASEMCVARTARDVAAVLDIVGGRNPGDTYAAPPPRKPYVLELDQRPATLRIGMLLNDPTGADEVAPCVASTVLEVGRYLETHGHVVSEQYPRALRHGPWPEPMRRALPVVLYREIERWSRRIGRELGPGDFENPSVWERAQASTSVGAADYAAGVDSLRYRAREIEQWWFDGWDLLVCPVTPYPPQELGLPIDDHRLMSGATFTVPFNISGQPAVSVPVGFTPDGLPIGVQLVAAYGREDLLVQLISLLEKHYRWGDQHPGLDARQPDDRCQEES